MKHKGNIIVLLVFAQMLNVGEVFAQSSELVFPIAAAFPSFFPVSAGFAFGGVVGFNLVLTESPYKIRIFSFSVPQARIIDDVDLEPDFGASRSLASIPRVALKVHDQSGLVLIYGQHSNGEQKIVAFLSESNGRLRRLWSLSYPPNAFFSAASDLAINTDGSRICWIYYLPRRQSGDVNTLRRVPVTEPAGKPYLVQSSATGLKLSEQLHTSAASTVTRQLALIRAEDGVQLASTELTFASLSASVFFDERNSRVVALATKTVFLFEPIADRLDLDSTIEPAISSSEVVGQGISKDGRFLLAYGGYTPDAVNPGGINYYVAYDLEQKTARELALSELLFPVSNAITFHQAKGLLLAPLTVELSFVAGPGPSVKNVVPRETDVIALGADGSLSRVAQVKLPKRSPDSARSNALSSYCNIEVSATGALAFIPSGNGRLFTIDTSNGEIVRDVLIDPNGLVSIKLLEPLNRLVASDLSNRFLLLDLETAPVINGIAVKRQSTIIAGENFLNGAHLVLDGVDLGVATRGVDNPSGEIVVGRSKKDFPRGQVFTFVIANPDGRRSKPFTFQR